MKKLFILIPVIAAVISYLGCSKTPSSPDVAATVNAVLTQAGQKTATATATQTAICSPTFTVTASPTPNITATVEFILTAVGAGNATATEQARETATAAAVFYTATATCTSTQSPDQTATAAAIGTIIANIHQTETAVAATATQSAETMEVSVPGGTFTQTDAQNPANSFSHTVSSFKLGKYLVTYDLWYAVYQWAVNNGYALQNAGAEGSQGTAGAAPTAAKYQPVTMIGWRDAIVWCNAYSQMMGLQPVYCSDAGFTTAIESSMNGAYGGSIDTSPGSFDNPFVNWNGNGYRLPTEGEYQYAACYVDGTNWTPYNYASGATADYNNYAATAAVGWNGGNSGHVTHNVGVLAPNALGIYDMSGNVLEMCWDWIDFSYPSSPSTDYRGPDYNPSDPWRVMRGGDSVDDNLFFLQVGCRNYVWPNNPTIGVGLRIARTY